jgi:hypothetical protein
LSVWGNRYRPDAGNDRAFIQAIAPEDSTARLRYHTVERRIRKQHSKETHAYLGTRQVWREPVLAIDRGESLEANVTAESRVLRLRWTNFYSWHGRRT